MVVTRKEKAELENWAAAYAAEAVSASDFERRDENTGQQIRDFDLVFADGHLEPLEITIHAEKAVFQTMGRMKERLRELKADVGRVWLCSHPYFRIGPTGENLAYDLKACER